MRGLVLCSQKGYRAQVPQHFLDSFISHFLFIYDFDNRKKTFSHRGQIKLSRIKHSGMSKIPNNVILKGKVSKQKIDIKNELFQDLKIVIRYFDMPP